MPDKNTASAVLANANWSRVDRGIETAIIDGWAYFRVSADRAKGQPSASGKMILTGSSAGGFASVPDGDGMRFNLSAGYPAKG